MADLTREEIERLFFQYGPSHQKSLCRQLLAAMDLLQRIHGWDHLGSAADGPYWRGEIQKLLTPKATP